VGTVPPAAVPKSRQPEAEAHDLDKVIQYRLYKNIHANNYQQLYHPHKKSRVDMEYTDLNLKGLHWLQTSHWDKVGDGLRPQDKKIATGTSLE
jgi:hypothetical protein